MKCPNCGKHVPEGKKFCGKCGTKLIQPIGKAIKSSPKNNVPSSETKKASEPNKRKWLLPLVSGFIGLAIFIILVIKPSVVEPKQESSPEVKVENTEYENKQASEPIMEAEEDRINSLGFLEGTWGGTAEAENGDQFDITFRFGKNCQFNQICGSFNISSFACSGDVKFTELEGDKYIFLATNKSGCSDEDAILEWLKIINDKELEYYSKGEWGVSEGILDKR